MDAFENLRLALRRLRSGEAITREQFVRLMDAEYARRVPNWRSDQKDPLGYVREVLTGFEAEDMPFGHPDYDWGRSGALDLVLEDLSCWEG